jgi:predicted NAD/FAD-binding protein
MKIAVIGAGIAGMATAWLLRDQHEVVLFEAEERAGGHADTQEVELGGRLVTVDTGFIVYNEANYPHLTALFAELGVATEPSEMSFAVSRGGGALEYGGGDLRQLFAQKRNALSPRFWGMVRDVLRFWREAPALLADGGDARTLGAWLDDGSYGRAFIEDHILPMGAAIWSASIDGMRAFPARHFVRFFHNHGLLRLADRPAWRTVTGGSRRYVERLTASLADMRLGCAVRAVVRDESGVMVHASGEERFDAVVMACHAPQALALLATPSAEERAILGAIKGQPNRAVLHTDASLMPRRRAAWSAWNYLAEGRASHRQQIAVTYWMNRLQNIPGDDLFVTLNPPREPRGVLLERTYSHPQFDRAAMAAQARLPEIQGQGGVYFAGAWTGWGFHEDGIASAVRVAGLLGMAAPWRAAERVAA